MRAGSPGAHTSQWARPRAGRLLGALLSRAEGLGNCVMSSPPPQWRWDFVSCKLEEGAPEQVPAGGRSYLRTLDPEGGAGAGESQRRRNHLQGEPLSSSGTRKRRQPRAQQPTRARPGSSEGSSRPFFLRCGPRASSISRIWKLVRNAEPGACPRPANSESAS